MRPTTPRRFPASRADRGSRDPAFSLAETGKYGQGFLTFNNALVSAIEMANNAFQREGGCRASPPCCAISTASSAGCSPPTSSSLPAAHRWERPRSPPTSPLTWHAAAPFLAERADLAPEDQGHDGAVVGFFSLEMSAEQLATRILSEQAGIPSEKIRRGMIDESEFKRLVEASREMSAIPCSLTRPAASPLPSWRRGRASSSVNMALA